MVWKNNCLSAKPRSFCLSCSSVRSFQASGKQWALKSNGSSAMQGPEQKRRRRGSWSPHKKNPGWQRQTWCVRSGVLVIEGREAAEAACSTSRFYRILGNVHWILLGGNDSYISDDGRS